MCEVVWECHWWNYCAHKTVRIKDESFHLLHTSLPQQSRPLVIFLYWQKTNHLCVVITTDLPLTVEDNIKAVLCKFQSDSWSLICTCRPLQVVLRRNWKTDRNAVLMSSCMPNIIRCISPSFFPSSRILSTRNGASRDVHDWPHDYLHASVGRKKLTTHRSFFLVPIEVKVNATYLSCRYIVAHL